MYELFDFSDLVKYFQSMRFEMIVKELFQNVLDYIVQYIYIYMNPSGVYGLCTEVPLIEVFNRYLCMFIIGTNL